MINRVICRALSLFAVTLAITASATPAEQTLVTRLVNDHFELSVPVSHLVLIIPHGGLGPVDGPRAGASASPRYFHLGDPGRGLIITGWFEPAATYKGIDALWKGETDAWMHTGQPTPTNVLMRRIANWDAVLYDLNVPGGSNAHIRAEWVALNTWIDLHISITSTEPIETARAMAMDMLRNIRVNEVH